MKSTKALSTSRKNLFHFSSLDPPSKDSKIKLSNKNPNSLDSTPFAQKSEKSTLITREITVSTLKLKEDLNSFVSKISKLFLVQAITNKKLLSRKNSEDSTLNNLAAQQPALSTKDNKSMMWDPASICTEKTIKKMKS